MTAAERAELRQAINTARRERLFTTDAYGRVILRPQYRDTDHITHGTSWGYRGHLCRCHACSRAHSVEQKRYRAQRKAAA